TDRSALGREHLAARTSERGRLRLGNFKGEGHGSERSLPQPRGSAGFTGSAGSYRLLPWPQRRQGPSRPSAYPLVVPAKIHTRVERGDLVSITVEHLGCARQNRTDASLAGLRPAGMINVGVDVRVEPVLLRVGDVPGRFWLLVNEPDSD